MKPCVNFPTRRDKPALVDRERGLIAVSQTGWDAAFRSPLACLRFAPLPAGTTRIELLLWHDLSHARDKPTWEPLHEQIAQATPFISWDKPSPEAARLWHRFCDRLGLDPTPPTFLAEHARRPLRWHRLFLAALVAAGLAVPTTALLWTRNAPDSAVRTESPPGSPVETAADAGPAASLPSAPPSDIADSVARTMPSEPASALAALTEARRLLQAGEPVPEALLGRLPEDIREMIRRLPGGGASPANDRAAPRLPWRAREMAERDANGVPVVPRSLPPVVVLPAPGGGETARIEDLGSFGFRP